MTGFPRIGGGGRHVAHMLWGGLLMLIGLVLLLAVIGRRTKRLAAVIGGAGFGLFAWHWFQRAVLVLFVAQGLIGIPVFLVLLLGPAALSVPGRAAMLEILDAGTLIAQATDSSEGFVGSAASTLSALLSLAFAM